MCVLSYYRLINIGDLGSDSTNSFLIKSEARLHTLMSGYRDTTNTYSHQIKPFLVNIFLIVRFTELSSKIITSLSGENSVSMSKKHTHTHNQKLRI